MAETYESQLARERARYLAWWRGTRALELEEPQRSSSPWRLDPDWLVPHFTRSGVEYYRDIDGTIAVDFGSPPAEA